MSTSDLHAADPNALVEEQEEDDSPRVTVEDAENESDLESESSLPPPRPRHSSHSNYEPSESASTATSATATANQSTVGTDNEEGEEQEEDEERERQRGGAEEENGQMEEQEEEVEEAAEDQEQLSRTLQLATISNSSYSYPHTSSADSAYPQHQQQQQPHYSYPQQPHPSHPSQPHYYSYTQSPHPYPPFQPSHLSSSAATTVAPSSRSLSPSLLFFTARQLGIDLSSHPHHQWIIEAMLLTPLPHQWLRCYDENGYPYYWNQQDKTSQWKHPLAHKFQALQQQTNHYSRTRQQEQPQPSYPSQSYSSSSYLPESKEEIFEPSPSFPTNTRRELDSDAESEEYDSNEWLSGEEENGQGGGMNQKEDEYLIQARQQAAQAYSRPTTGHRFRTATHSARSRSSSSATSRPVTAATQRNATRSIHEEKLRMYNTNSNMDKPASSSSSSSSRSRPSSGTLMHSLVRPSPPHHPPSSTPTTTRPWSSVTSTPSATTRTQRLAAAAAASLRPVSAFPTTTPTSASHLSSTLPTQTQTWNYPSPSPPSHSPLPSPSSTSSSLKSPHQRVTETLRIKVSELISLRSLLSKHSSSLSLSLSHLSSSRSSLRLLLSSIHSHLSLSSSRLSIWQQSAPSLEEQSQHDRRLYEAFVEAESGGKEVERKTREWEEKGRELEEEGEKLREECEKYLKETAVMMQIDRQCLGMQLKASRRRGRGIGGMIIGGGTGGIRKQREQGQEEEEEVENEADEEMNETFAISSSTTLPTSSSLDLLPHLFSRSSSLRPQVSTYISSTDTFISHCQSTLKQFHRTCSISLRTCARESTGIKQQYSMEKLSHHSRFRSLLGRKKEIQQLLLSLLPSLSLCEKTYQLRLQQPHSHMAKEIIESLEYEVEEMNRKIGGLEEELRATEEEMERVKEKEEELERKMKKEEVRYGFYLHCLNCDYKLAKNGGKAKNGTSSAASSSAAENADGSSASTPSTLILPTPPSSPPAIDPRVRSQLIRDQASAQERLRVRRVRQTRAAAAAAANEQPTRYRRENADEYSLRDRVKIRVLDRPSRPVFEN